MSSLGFTSKEQRNLGLLVHLMTSNPKILYAPAGSEADRVILKVCAAGGLCPLGQELRELGRGLCRLGTQCGGAAVGRIGTRGVQPWLLRTPGLGSLGEGTCEQV